MVCVGVVRVGGAAPGVLGGLGRASGRLRERTRVRAAARSPAPRRACACRGVRDRPRRRASGEAIEVDLPARRAAHLDAQAGRRASRGTSSPAARARTSTAGVVDDTAGYHARHTEWRWAAGVGATADGRDVRLEPRHRRQRRADRLRARRVGRRRAAEVGPGRLRRRLDEVRFAEGGALRFAREAERERDDNLLLVRPRLPPAVRHLRGTLPGGVELATGWASWRHTARGGERATRPGRPLGLDAAARRWRRSSASSSLECIAPISSRSGSAPEAMISTARSTLDLAGEALEQHAHLLLRRAAASASR